MSETVNIFKRGILKSNPVLVLLLGLCPTLAVSTSINNGLAMTGATLFVLINSNIITSIISRFTPDSVRIPVFIVVIATLVTIVDLTMQAYLPSLSESIGIYIPLIVVNCIILGRAEAFASKNGILNSISDALGIGLGFGLAIVSISFFRQILGTGKLSVFGWKILSIPGLSDRPISVFQLPMGAFLIMGLLLATLRYTGAIK